MQPQLISLSADLSQLWEEGYEMEINGGQYLLVHHIPYVNKLIEVKYGTLACILTLRTPNTIGIMQDHTVFFIGETPCDLDGQPLDSIIINSCAQNIASGLLVNFHFSSKPRPTGVYPSYYEKMRTYAEILSSQAKAIDNTVTSKPKKQIS